MNKRNWTPEPWVHGENPTIAPPITGFERSEFTGEPLVTLLWSDYLHAARCVDACVGLSDKQLAGGLVSADLLKEAVEHHGPACKSECDHPSCVLFRKSMTAVDAARKAAKSK